MTIEEYLRSDKARTDIETLMAAAAPCWTLHDSRAFYVDRDESEAWERICLQNNDDNRTKIAAAYYRPDGDRFIVSDLGEGVRALRSRTGRCFLTFPLLREMFESTPGDPMVGFCADTGLYALGDWQDGRHAHVAAEHLPDAVCRVLLASYRIANLGAKGGE